MKDASTHLDPAEAMTAWLTGLVVIAREQTAMPDDELHDALDVALRVEDGSTNFIMPSHPEARLASALRTLIRLSDDSGNRGAFHESTCFLVAAQAAWSMTSPSEHETFHEETCDAAGDHPDDLVFFQPIDVEDEENLEPMALIRNMAHNCLVLSTGYLRLVEKVANDEERNAARAAAIEMHCVGTMLFTIATQDERQPFMNYIDELFPTSRA